MSKTRTLARITELGLLAVLRGPTPDLTVQMVDALVAGGVTGIEITYTTPDAVNVVRQTRPDVLILDVMLPGKSGYDILRELRTEFAEAELPVLMLTARGQMKDRELAERAGASRFMTKPFSNADMLEAVRSLAGA